MGRIHRLAALACVVLVVGSVQWLSTANCDAQDPIAGRREQLRAFMRAKLEHSQKLLEGLTMEDYDILVRHAQALSLLSLESNWQVLQTEEYINQSTEFRRAANALTEAARDKNLDGSTLAFMDVTAKCVACHKYVRKVAK